MLKSITRILPFLIVTLLSIGSVELFYGLAENYMVISEKKSAHSPGRTATGTVGKTNVTLQKHNNYDVIVQRDLFRTYISEPEAVEEVKENPLEGLETTTLDLVLMGTITGRADKSRAIILEKAKRKQEIYYTGDVVQGAEIKEILRGKVILSYRGKDEVLDMSEAAKMRPKTPTAPPAVSPAAPRRRVMTPARQRPARRVVPRNSSISNSAPETGITEDAEIAEEIEEEQEDLEEEDDVEQPDEFEDDAEVEVPEGSDGPSEELLPPGPPSE